jgi:hypothetical protein
MDLDEDFALPRIGSGNVLPLQLRRIPETLNHDGLHLAGTFRI